MLPFIAPVRDYDALEISLEKRFTNNWSLRAYYTLSRLEGNYSGLGNSDEQNTRGDPNNMAGTGGRRSANTSRLFDRPQTAYDMNGNEVYGDLATNRTHQLGAQFLYSFQFGLSAGLNQYIGSGSPRQTSGSLPIGNDFYPYGRGDLGRTDWLTQTDLSLYYTFGLGGGMNLTFGATVLNLFDEDTVFKHWHHSSVQDVPVDPADVAAGFDYAAELAALGPDALDPRFNQANGYQLPRELRFTIKLAF